MKVFDPRTSIIKPVAGANKKRAFVVAGPPGTGKSTLLGSMAEVVENVLVLATLPRELESWLYQKYALPYILFEDPEWVPAVLGEKKNAQENVLKAGKYNARAFAHFLEVLEWLRMEDEQYDAIIVDSGTELAELGWHAALAPFGVSTPSQIEGRSRWLPYETLDTHLSAAVDSLVSLSQSAKRPKHVGISWHTQPPKDDAIDDGGGTKVKKESADSAGAGVEFEGHVLPMVRGRFRRRLSNKVPTFVYTDVKIAYDVGSGLSRSNAATSVEYRIQVRPDMDRHTKLPGPLPVTQYIPNNFKALTKLLDEQEAAPAVPAANKKSGLRSKSSSISS